MRRPHGWAETRRIFCPIRNRVLGSSSGEKPAAKLPGDTTTPGWIILLPGVHEREIRLSDIVTDDSGAVGVVVAAERSDHGWRLNMRRVTV